MFGYSARSKTFGGTGFPSDDGPERYADLNKGNTNQTLAVEMLQQKVKEVVGNPDLKDQIVSAFIKSVNQGSKNRTEKERTEEMTKRFDGIYRECSQIKDATIHDLVQSYFQKIGKDFAVGASGQNGGESNEPSATAQ